MVPLSSKSTKTSVQNQDEETQAALFVALNPFASAALVASAASAWTINAVFQCILQNCRTTMTIRVYIAASAWTLSAVFRCVLQHCRYTSYDHSWSYSLGMDCQCGPVMHFANLPLYLLSSKFVSTVSVVMIDTYSYVNKPRNKFTKVHVVSS